MSAPDPPHRRMTLRRILATGAAALIPVVPIVIGLLLGGTGGHAGAATTAAARFTPAGGAPAAAASGSGSSPSAATGTPSSQTASRTTTAPSKPAGSSLPSGTGALVALVGHPTKLRSRPAGHAYATLATHTGFGSPTVVLVARLSGPWLGVIATQAGNHHLGWIRSTDTTLTRVDWSLRATLSRHQLTVMHGGRAVRHFTIAVGMPDAPTPIGRYEVTDRLTTGDPTGPYGCCILALSANAPHHISDWNGGNRIAIHSTTEVGSIGKSVSHGCMRLTLAEGRWLLHHVPLGTPTIITS